MNITEHTKAEIKKLHKAGLGYKRISQVLNVPYHIARFHSDPMAGEKWGRRSRKWKKNNPIALKIHTTLRSRVKSFKRAGKDKDDRVTNSDINSRDIVAKLKQNPHCYLTGLPIDLADTRSYQIDHIVPVSRGGTNDEGNIGLASKWANQAKGDMLVDEFVKKCIAVIVIQGFSVIAPDKNQVSLYERQFQKEQVPPVSS